jgi:hypothetical protein
MELTNRYEQLKSRLNFLIDLESHPEHGEIKSRERSLSIIETDLPRTFPNMKIFQPGEPLYEPL